VCVRKENDGGLQRWGRGERETGMERKEKREKVQEGEGAGGDARTVRRSNTCGEMREREREGNDEKYGAKTAGRWMKE
jgi:hypothetical protein